MTWGFVAAAAISVVGGAVASNQQKKGAKGAANAAAKGSALEVEERRRQYDQTRQDNMPFLEAGQEAVKRQNAFLGGDFTGFQNSPDYAYAQQQMTQGLDRSAAARGRLYSGGYGVDMARQLNGLANSNVTSYWNRLAGQAGQGQATGNALGAFGANMANANANSIGNAFGARASAYQQIGQANADFATGTAGAINRAYQGWNTQRRAGG